MGEPRPCPRSGGHVLRALFVGVCAFVLVTHAAAAAKKELQHPASTRQTTRVQITPTPAARLERQLAIVRKEQSVVRFFRDHSPLLRSPEHGAAARAELRRSTRRLAAAQKNVADLRRVLRAQTSRRLEALPPKAAICDAFDRFCGQALQVAWCESRLQTTAQNGQYLGLFQMGAYARELYGHGSTAHDQAVAAHRYFVASGRDWSPWSCKPVREAS